MSAKKRLDILLFERGLAESRQLAQSLVMEGHVLVNGRKEQKPGVTVPIDADLVVTGGRPKYVSRGGLKLEKALQVFGVFPEGMVALDTGASTGGFTDCLLQNGPKRSMPWTWDTVSLPGSCAPTSASSQSSAPTHGT
jgi:23S rRNA (cytidine1920-2'-O)/16S rRNA (cytidine1409-2'-O)-methyltransferase